MMSLNRSPLVTPNSPRYNRYVKKTLNMVDSTMVTKKAIPNRAPYLMIPAVPVGPFSRAFERDLDDPRKWQHLDDQPEAVSGGPLLNDFANPWPRDRRGR